MAPLVSARNSLRVSSRRKSRYSSPAPRPLPAGTPRIGPEPRPLDELRRVGLTSVHFRLLMNAYAEPMARLEECFVLTLSTERTHPDSRILGIAQLSYLLKSLGLLLAAGLCKLSERI